MQKIINIAHMQLKQVTERNLSYACCDETTRLLVLLCKQQIKI